MACLNMHKQADCQECFGDGWVWDEIWRCGDPECCGTPQKVRCPYCDSTWEYGDE